MSTLRVATDLRCEACRESIRPWLDSDPRVVRWALDLDNPDRILTVVSESIRVDEIAGMLSARGYKLLSVLPGESAAPVASAGSRAVPRSSYFPLLLIAFYLIVAVTLAQLAGGKFDFMDAMRQFMAGFFLVFSFFKLLDLQGFASAFSTYDLIARRWRGFGWLYPFIELALGAAYLANVWPAATNLVTLILMVTGAMGVVVSLRAGEIIRCACLGTVFNLPMSFVTLVEDLLMAVMAAVMLALLWTGH